MKNREEIINEFLNKDISKLDDFSPVVNNNEPFFKKADYEITEGIPKYFEPDELNRTSGAIAIISKYTLSIMVEKHLKYPDPNGWTEKINDSGIFQRCHCIAYRLSAKKNDKNNIFIGTDDLNKKIMNDIENDVEQYIKENSEKYIKILYRVTPIYKGKNQIPTGILIEAKSLDTEFTLCRFCYNIKEKVKFKYIDGSIIQDNRGIIKTIQRVKTSIEEKKRIKSKNVDLVVNSQTKKYHIENCKILNNIDPKYINEENPIAPKIHNLILLSQKANLEVPEEIRKRIQVINTFNISARYDDYKKSFEEKCTDEYTTEQIENIKEVRKWLKEQ